MKYKVGDKVRIKPLEWYEANKNENGEVGFFVKDMSIHCGKFAVVTSVNNKSYNLDIDYGEWAWDDDMLEDLNTEENKIGLLLKGITEVIKESDLGISVKEEDGKIIIEPLKKEEFDLPIGTFCVVTNSMCNNPTHFSIRRYAGNGYTYNEGEGFSEGVLTEKTWNVIIPFDKFNPNDIEGSLEYNIIK